MQLAARQNEHHFTRYCPSRHAILIEGRSIIALFPRRATAGCFDFRNRTWPPRCRHRTHGEKSDDTCALAGTKILRLATAHLLALRRGRHHHPRVSSAVISTYSRAKAGRAPTCPRTSSSFFRLSARCVGAVAMPAQKRRRPPADAIRRPSYDSRLGITREDISKRLALARSTSSPS